jgi:hypothetical protein
MKGFVFGGYGKTGLPATKLLAGSDLVSEITVAGRNLERAEKAASEIGEKATAIQADGTDEQQLTSLLAGYDIVVNTATYEAVPTILPAAIRVGAHYCDMDFVEQVLQLEPDAKAAGITAILAAGISPSISNLMGIHAALQLDEVEQLQLGRADIYNFQNGRELTPRQWLKDPQESVTELPEFRSFIAMMMKILQNNGFRTVMDYRDGQWVELDPIRNGLDVPQLESGKIISYPYVSCDSFWGALPSDFARLPPVEVWFSPFPLPLHDQLRELALCVLDGSLDYDAAVDSFFDSVERDPYRWLTPSDDFAPIPKMWARAVGYKDGNAARHTCLFTAPMWDVGGYFLTSVALAAAVLKILRGEVKERGVMHAQTVLQPQSFFDEMATLIKEYLPDGNLLDNSFEWLY